MSEIKRFVYVQSSTGSVRHILFGPRVEGALTVCRRPVSTSWTWRRPGVKMAPNLPRCAACAEIRT